MISQERVEELTDGVEKKGKDTWISSAQSRKRTQEARSFRGFRDQPQQQESITVIADEEEAGSDPNSLEEEVKRLRSEVNYLRSALNNNPAPSPEDYDDLPFRFVFLAKNTTGVSFTERGVISGATADLLTRREGSFIEPAADEVFLVAFNDPASSTQKFVKIAGGTGGTSTPETIGTFKGQVHSMVSNNQDGWEFPITVI